MNDEFDSKTATLLVERYKQAEDLSSAGWRRRLEVGWLLFELMDRMGETHLRRILPGFCRELTWDAATGAMRLVLNVGPEFWPASSWLDKLGSAPFAWMNNRYRQAEFLSYSGLLRSVQLGDRLLDLRIHAGEVGLKRLLAESCPEIPWEDAQSAMNFAVGVDRDFLKASCLPNFQDYAE